MYLLDSTLIIVFFLIGIDSSLDAGITIESIIQWNLRGGIRTITNNVIEEGIIQIWE